MELSQLNKPSRNYTEKIKATWYLDDVGSKIWFVLSSIALLFLIVRLIAGRGLW